MKELSRWLSEQEGSTEEIRQFAGPPQGDALVSHDPSSDAPAASFNRNRIVLCGARGGLTQDGLRALLDNFESRRIQRVFAWLSPGLDDALVREWLLSMSFVRVPWTRYPTLLFNAAARQMPATQFEIRQIDATDFAAARVSLENAVMEGYERTLGKPGFHHYLLLDAGRPIALAALVKFGEIGYLTYAGTLERERRRGAQCALIAHRVAAAQSMGCTHIVSQTLTMLEHSFANLQRCGFREVYEQEVFEYVRK
jgi:hypothetical protein